MNRNCYNCYNCDSCNSCNFCKFCKFCNYCKFCKFCNSCDFCNSCKNLVNGFMCVNLKLKKKDKNKYWIFNKEVLEEEWEERWNICKAKEED